MLRILVSPLEKHLQPTANMLHPPLVKFMVTWLHSRLENVLGTNKPPAKVLPGQPEICQTEMRSVKLS